MLPGDSRLAKAGAWKLIVLLSVSMFVLVSCSGGGSAATPAPGQPTTAAPLPTTAATQAATLADDEKPLAQPYKTTIAVVNNLFGTVFWVGVEKGMFLKHGIQAQIKTFSSGTESSKALTAGDVNAGTSAMNNFQTEVAGGIKHVGLFTTMGNGASLINDAPLAITARPDSGIRADHPEDLKSKTVGLSLGGTAELYLRAVLRKAGVDAKDVKMVNVPPANSVTVLNQKNVDAISSWEPYQTVILKQVPGAVMVQRAGGYFGYVIFGMVEEKTAKENPDYVLRLVAAYAEAAAWTRQNREEAGVVATHWIEGLDPKDAAEGLKNVAFDPRITTFTKQGWDLSNNLLIQDAKIKTGVPMEGIFDTSYLEKVMKDHPDYFKDLGPATGVTIK